LRHHLEQFAELLFDFFIIHELTSLAVAPFLGARHCGKSYVPRVLKSSRSVGGSPCPVRRLTESIPIMKPKAQGRRFSCARPVVAWDAQWRWPSVSIIPKRRAVLCCTGRWVAIAGK